MEEFKSDMKCLNDVISTLSQKVEQLNNQIKISGGHAKVSNPLNEVFKVKSIDRLDLKNPDGGFDNKKGNIIKKIYKNSIEVACKSIPPVEKDGTAESQKLQTELAILDLLGQCDYIITFYGLSIIGEETVMKDCNVKVVMDYMTQAANAGNATALYTLGDIYLNGKLGVDVDKEKGIELIKLAALQGQPSANEDLKRLNIPNT
ncbi:1652_t:CDS:2 [Acaulospora colombiana]|uniref:1652_t:CDS:1 n=1 Tax=Acaulospora colombiana TaxID=27376 RepID=A0ACA9JY21_9GLOM|nr:1652_t:CDS:2 [Acaulospora colombiana]